MISAGANETSDAARVTTYGVGNQMQPYQSMTPQQPAVTMTLPQDPDNKYTVADYMKQQQKQQNLANINGMVTNISNTCGQMLSTGLNYALQAKDLNNKLKSIEANQTIAMRGFDIQWQQNEANKVVALEGLKVQKEVANIAAKAKVSCKYLEEKYKTERSKDYLTITSAFARNRNSYYSGTPVFGNVMS